MFYSSHQRSPQSCCRVGYLSAGQRRLCHRFPLSCHSLSQPHFLPWCTRVQTWKKARFELRAPFPALPGLAMPRDTASCVIPGSLSRAQICVRRGPARKCRSQLYNSRSPNSGGITLSVGGTKGLHFCEHEAKIRIRV